MQFDVLKTITNSSLTKPKRFCSKSYFYYTVNPKNDTITISIDRIREKRITISKLNFITLHNLNPCIQSCITKYLHELPIYQKCHDNIYKAIKEDFENIPYDNIDNKFISTFIRDYDFNKFKLCDESKTFIQELKVKHGHITDLIKDRICWGRIRKYYG